MSRKIIKEILYWGQVFLLPIYWISFITPRSKKIWVFGSTFGTRFADNPKYFYLYLNQYHKDDIRCIWITKSKAIYNLLKEQELEGYYLYSIKGVMYSLRAKVYLYDNYSKDICYFLSGGAKKINMWHGIPLKKIQNDNIFDNVRNPKSTLEKFKYIPRRLSDEKPSHYVLATSEHLRPIFSSAFNTNNVIISGYPRNDLLKGNVINNILDGYDKKLVSYIETLITEKRIALYMPTFRESEISFFDIIDIKAFNDYLKKENIIFCVKLHPKSKLQEYFLNMELSNLIVVNSQSDPYSYLVLADVLITDYSSIYFDFLLLNRPIIFFPYDLERYLEDSREMYFEYNEFTPGIKVYNQSELEKAILVNTSRSLERKSILDKVYSCNNNLIGSEDLFNQIKNII